MIRQCVILAGGLGTRLGQLTADTPKPLLPVAGRPFLSYLVENLRCQSIGKITILAGFKGTYIQDYFANDADVDVLIEPAPMGTGGALRFAAEHDALEDEFFMINGDTFFDINLANLVCSPVNALPDQVLGRIALRHMQDTGRYGVVLRDGTLVTSFSARPDAPNSAGYVNGGIYHLNRAIVDLIPEGNISLEAEVFPSLVAAKQLHAFGYDRPFIDIGIPADYEKAQSFVPDLMQRPALFLDRDGVINEEVHHLHKVEDFIWVKGAAELIARASDLGYHVFVVTNQGGVARGLYGEDQVQKLHGWISDQVFKSGGRISDIRYCPHNPEGTVPDKAIPCSWRKPAPGMLNDLIKHHSVDHANSLMVGDRETDMQAAKAAGIKGVHFTGGNLFDLVAPLLKEQA